jgi:RNA polymerase sigma factor (sigma-70 family)
VEIAKNASFCEGFNCASADEEDSNDAGSFEVSQATESQSKIDARIIAEYGIERYRRQLLWAAARVTNCREDAEDVLQQALLKAFINLYMFRRKSQMKTWLTAIVRNAALEYVRNQRRRAFVRIDSTLPLDDDGHDGFQLVEPSMNPEERYERCEKGEMLRAAIQHMNHVNRRVFNM